ncbi:MAG TPA: trehalose-6-phosphate synthase, partial [bacterium]|nr:trehalose-6-phosphate synthase [bacterium]
MAIERARLQRLDDILNGRELVIVSNREPYTHRSGPGGPMVERPVGGLVAALDPVMQVTSGTWIAWGDGDADFDVTDAHARIRVPDDHPRYTLKRIALSKPEVDGYYYGYANQVLWPLCHMVLDQIRIRARYWETYQAVNQQFAEAVASEAPGGAIVWLHDYHLATCPRVLRRLRPDLFLMQFWHVPWPAWDAFRVCPDRVELLDGLLANDLLTFQHERHVAHFLECAQRDLGAHVIGRTIQYAGRRTRVEAFPISVDVPALDEVARSSQTERWMDGLSRLLGLDGRRAILSVDRLDYTKGILKRLRAIDQLLTRRPEYRSRVVFIQKMAASRGQIKVYRDLRAKVEERIERLNAAHGTGDWLPVVALPDPLPPAGMAALYRLADVCVVSPIQDGMNLGAKEFVACQVGEPGA